VYLSDIFLWIGLAFWATGWYLSQGKSWRWGPWYVILPLLLLVALSLLSTLWAENASQASYTSAWRLWLMALYLALVNEGIRTLVPAGLALLTIGLLQGIVAWGQVI
jgi:hypothetical protein